MHVRMLDCTLLPLFVTDMGTNNVKTMKLLGSPAGQPFFQFQNQAIATIYDPPHLLKCTRNLFLYLYFYYLSLDPHRITKSMAIEIVSYSSNKITSSLRFYNYIIQYTNMFKLQILDAIGFAVYLRVCDVICGLLFMCIY